MSEETQLFLDQLKIESGKYFEYLLNQGLRDGYREASEAMDHFTKFLKRSS